MCLKLYLLGGLFIGAVAFVPAVYERLAPESSPIARGAVHAAKHRCADHLCSQELQGLAHQCDDLAANTACDDVVAYWNAARLKHGMYSRLAQAPDNPILQGERLARERNCFRCHGELGQGGMANKGALKSYIPGYFGSDFRYLTEDRRRDVVRAWIETGYSRALTEHPVTGFIAHYFLSNQAISMPSFARLPAAEIDILTDYVIALNLLGSMDARGVERYAALTLLPRRDQRLETLFPSARTSTVAPSTSKPGSSYAYSPTHYYSQSNR